MAKKNIIQDLVNELKADPDYRRGWVANIAMAFKDRVDQYKKENNKVYLDKVDFHIIANEAAEAFINTLVR